MKKTIPEIVSENIVALISLRGESTVSAGKKSKIDQKTVWNYTQPDFCNPTLKKLDALANALDVHPSMLLIDGAFTREAPSKEAARLLERIVRLKPAAQRQVSEFMEMWEQQKTFD